MLGSRLSGPLWMLALAGLGCGGPQGVAAPESSGSTGSDDDPTQADTRSATTGEPTDPEDSSCARTHVGSVYVDEGVDLQDWAGTREITGDLVIARTEPPLGDLSALGCLERVGGSVKITSTTGLVDLRGLEALSFVGAYFQVSGNADLRSLDGLDALRYVGSLEIAGNPSLQRLGLGHLQAVGSLSVGRDCTAYGNEALTTIDGFDSLLSLQSLRLYANPSLVSLAGLYELAERGVHVGRVTAQDNPSLDPGDVEAAAAAVDAGATACGNLGQEPCPPCPPR